MKDITEKMLPILEKWVGYCNHNDNFDQVILELAELVESEKRGLYRKIDPLKEGDKVQFVGVYVLRWPEVSPHCEPKVGFVEADEDG